MEIDNNIPNKDVYSSCFGYLASIAAIRIWNSKAKYGSKINDEIMHWYTSVTVNLCFSSKISSLFISRTKNISKFCASVDNPWDQEIKIFLKFLPRLDTRWGLHWTKTIIIFFITISYTPLSLFFEQKTKKEICVQMRRH